MDLGDFEIFMKTKNDEYRDHHRKKWVEKKQVTG
jgi:hypothetical protein